MVLKKRVLMVDDDPGILEAVEIILTESGYEVITVRDALETERVIKEFMPDLVMVDIQMPKISGEELCRRIKSNTALGNLRVVLLSASSRTQKISQDCQADDYLAKPFDMDELLTKIETLLS